MNNQQQVIAGGKKGASSLVIIIMLQRTPTIIPFDFHVIVMLCSMSVQLCQKHKYLHLFIGIQQPTKRRQNKNKKVAKWI